LSSWDPNLLQVLQYYFTSNYIATGIIAAALALGASFGIFALTKSHSLKSRSLLSSIVISTSMWVFVLSSLVLCAVFMRDYGGSVDDAVLEVAKFALIPTVVIGPVLSYFLRSRAVKQIYPVFTFNSNSVPDALRLRVSNLFSNLLSTAGLSGVSLSVVSGAIHLPASAALDWKGRKAVVISSGSVQTLDDEEVKAVLAHELGHLVHKDSQRKTFATTYRSAFIFDPVAHFVEAAIYRDGELYADEYSADLTKRPAALASALIKIHESMSGAAKGFLNPESLSMLLNRGDSGLFSKQPSLALRVKRLLEMEDRTLKNPEIGTRAAA
jgi:heat shock protein HtpX